MEHPYGLHLKHKLCLLQLKYMQKISTIFTGSQKMNFIANPMTKHFNILPWTTTLKSLSWSPASLVATHWNRAVSETWARETTSCRPLAATRNPLPCLTGVPSLYHLEINSFYSEYVCAHVYLYLCSWGGELTWWQVQVFQWPDTLAPKGCWLSLCCWSHHQLHQWKAELGWKKN